MEAENSTLEVAVAGDEALVHPVGQGSFKISPALKKFGTATLERGCVRLVFEMQDCRGMDSTFMGVVAGLALTLQRRQGEVVMRNLSDRNRTLLETLGLDRLVRIQTPGAEAPPPAAPLERLDTAADKRSTAATMLNAHETLAQATPANRIRFKDVLAFLKEDLDRMDAPNGRKG